MKPWLISISLALVSLATASAQNQKRPRALKPSQRSFTVIEASIPEMQAAMRTGRVTSRELVLQYLTRIALYEDKLHAAITVNPNALKEAEALDRERARGRIRGPLHGIPIALKANWVAGSPTPMPGNYSAIAGYGMNPYDPRRDPREASFDGRPALAAGGSSSGIGTAANFWAANVGTETSGSILNPANQNMLAAIKPTVGRISRYGVIPITADQDTPGPLAKSVTNAAILLGVMEGAAPDPNDPATRACQPPPRHDYRRFLKPNGLQGARIGIPRAFYYDEVVPPGTIIAGGGLNPNQKLLMAEAIEILKKRGAIIVDPADIPSVTSADPQSNLVLWSMCSNLAHQPAGAIKYGQSQLDISDEMDVDADRARYEADRAKDIALAGTYGIDAALKENHLDALLFPGATGAAIAAKPGYPSVIVPFGMIANEPMPPFPDGFDAKPAPFGVSFTGTACSEPRLIELAYAFEHATNANRGFMQLISADKVPARPRGVWP